MDAQFMRHVDGQLQPVGGIQTVNADDPPDTDQDWSSIAMNRDGRSVIVWKDTRTGDGDIFGQLFDGENKVGGNFQISTSQAPLSTRPEVGMKDGGFDRHRPWQGEARGQGVYKRRRVSLQFEGRCDRGLIIVRRRSEQV